MFAIQTGLLLAFAISSITAISGVFNTEATLAKFYGEGQYPSAPIFLWNFRMLFGSLLVVYSLNVVVALYCPLTKLAYMLAVGNMIRVAYIAGKFMINPEKMALLNFAEDGKMLKIICAVQTVLAVVIAGSAYVSSTDPAYVAFAANYAAEQTAAGLPDNRDVGPYIYFVYGMCGVGILGRVPQLLDPVKGMQRFMAEDRPLPSDKSEMTMLEFAFGFTAVNYILTWSFLLFIVQQITSMVPIAGFFCLVCGTFIVVLAKTLAGISDFGFAVPPMLFFFCLVSTMLGASLLTFLQAKTGFA